jgi:hypothetical protein
MSFMRDLLFSIAYILYQNSKKVNSDIVGEIFDIFKIILDKPAPLWYTTRTNKAERFARSHRAAASARLYGRNTADARSVRVSVARRIICVIRPFFVLGKKM